MQSLEVWKAVTMDRSNFLDHLIALLSEHNIRYCVIGGQGVNAYVEPLISLDLDLVVAVSQLELVESLLDRHFKLERFAHSLNISAAGSDLRVQIRPIRVISGSPIAPQSGTCLEFHCQWQEKRNSSGQDLGRQRSQTLPEQTEKGSFGYRAVARNLSGVAGAGSC